jgi:cysteinyl-tRNA synthetase
LLNAKIAAVHEALADSFDTPTVINHLGELVNATNSYLQ